jgi:hypothetical protein
MAKKEQEKQDFESKAVYVEFPLEEEEADGQQPAEVDLEAWQGQSAQALDQMVAALQEVARRVVAGMDALPKETRPAEVSLYFGVDSDPDAGAVVAYNPKKATFSARMVWYHRDKPVASLRPTPGLVPPIVEDDTEDLLD